jgi:transposase
VLITFGIALLRQIPTAEAVGHRLTSAASSLAAEFLTDLRRLDTQLRESKKLAVMVRASETTLTGLFGAGPAAAATIIGDAGDASRFPPPDRFAACNGTPAGVSSGGRKIYRLSRRGNRRINHALHMAAITQIRQRHSDGRACYGKKIAEGKTPGGAHEVVPARRQAVR